MSELEETAVSESRYDKEFGPLDKAREQSGLYKLGFERESAMGLLLPFILIGAVGGSLGLLIWLWL